MIRRRRSLIAVAALSCVSSAVMAQVATTDDVVVMRRPIAAPKVRQDTGPVTPTPGVTPTPTPVETPTPTPDPTPEPTPTPTPTPTSAYRKGYERISTASTTGVWGSGVVSMRGLGLRCFDESAQSVDMSLCQASPEAQEYRTVPVTGGSQAYRTIIMTPADMLGAFPFANNVETVCKGAARIGNASWKLRCDPSLIGGRYAWFPTHATWAPQLQDVRSSQVYKLRPHSSYFVCYDTQTGVPAPDQSVCSVIPKPTDDIEIPAQFDSDMRVIQADYDSVASVMAYGDPDAICATTGISFNPGPGIAAQTWRVSCDPDFLRNHFKRVATTVTNISSQTVPLTGSGAYQITTAAAGLECIDTDTGQPSAESWRCTYMPTGPDGGFFDVPSIFESQLRVVEFDWNWLLQKAPGLTNRDSFCNRAYSVKPGTSTVTQSWTLKCDPGAARIHYERYASSITTVAGNYNILPLANGLSLNATGIKCRDTDTGTDTADTNCTYLSKGALEGVFQTPIIGFSRNLRRVALVEADLRALAPNQAQVDTFCNGASLNLREEGSSANISYRLACNAEAIREHHQKVGFILATAATSYNIFPISDGFSFRVTDYRCRDTDPSANNLLEASTVCQYYDGDPNGYYKVPVQLEPQLLRLSIKRADIRALHPFVQEASLENLCKGSSNIRNAGDTGYKNYDITCDNPDALRLHHQLVRRNVSTAQATYNTLPLSSGVTFNTYATACRDTDSSTFVALPASDCAALTDQSALERVVLPHYGYDSTARTVDIKVSDLTAANPWLAKPSEICGMTVRVRANESTTAYVNYTARCI